ncbi:MAG: alpha/beta hydrolase [Acidimicrobiia bacterium]
MHRLVIPLLVLLAACSTPPSNASDTFASTLPSTTIVATETTETVETSTTSTTAAQPIEQILYKHWKGSFEYGDGLRVDVHAPEVRSNHPIAITVHGGGWFAGRLDSMGQLADGLAARGFVVFNATYRTIAQGGSFPSTVEDVACAVAYARDRALDYSTTANHFTLIGHSAGAHLTSLVAFSPTTFGGECEGADVPVDAWVGLAGSYNTDLYAFLLQPFFGTAFAEDPEPWRAGNPYTYVESIPPDVDLLFIHGDADELVPVSMTEDLYLAAEQAGASATLKIVSNAGHGEVTSSRLVGDLIAELVAGDQ